ncbi:MAG: ABC transporter substrate-binding protein [Limnochordales bacterium]|nr:ABC transporter substrate-binding protein [Limnochordales bacterium]
MQRWMTTGLMMALLAGLLGGAAAAQEIVVGLNAELTGSIPVVGQSSRNGAQLAVDQINAAGGLEVGGRRYTIRLVIEDNEDDAASAVAATTKLITQNRVVAVVGPNASRNAVPAAQIAENMRTPLISPWSTNPATTAGKRYVFRAAFIDDFQGQVVAAFAREHLGAQTAAVLFDIASEYNKGIAEIFRESFQALGGRVVAWETYTTGDRDFSSQLTNIRAANPDVLFLPNYYSEVPLQVQQAQRLGISAHIIGSDSWGSAELLALGGAAMEGLFFTTHYAPDIATPAAREFIAAYEARYGSTPDDVAALSYDSMQLLFHALQKAGRVDREAVRDALASITDFEGVTGSMRFEGTGDPIKSAVVIQIKDGRFTYYTSVAP